MSSSTTGTMTAWAVVAHNEPLQKIELPIPEPIGTEILIKVTHSGICHSDLHFWEGFYDVCISHPPSLLSAQCYPRHHPRQPAPPTNHPPQLGNGNKMHLASRGIKLPQAVGHEIFGTVAALGPAASGISLGSPRIVYPWLGCGACRRCQQGSDNLCASQKSLGVMQNGGMAEYVVVPSAKYLVDAGGVDPSVACTFGCSGITVLSAIRKVSPVGAELDPEDAVVLIGAGGLGLSAISMLRAVGHRKIISLDIDEGKLEVARRAGATATINSRAEEAVTEVLKKAGGPVLAVIDFVNASKTAELAFGVLAKGGTMVCVGVMGGELNISLVGMIFKAATIMGNNTGTVAHLEEVAKLAREGKLAPIPITVVPRGEAHDALMKLRDGKVTGRIVLKY